MLETLREHCERTSHVLCNSSWPDTALGTPIISGLVAIRNENAVTALGMLTDRAKSQEGFSFRRSPA
jgi:hypothetical protein